MTGVCVGGTPGHKTHGERPPEDGGGDQGDAAANRGTPGVPRGWKKQEGLSWGAGRQEGARPYHTWTWDIWPPECVRTDSYGFQAPRPPARRAVLAVQEMHSADKPTPAQVILGGMYSGHLVSAYANTNTGGTTFPTPLFICKHTAAERSRDSRVLS